MSGPGQARLDQALGNLRAASIRVIARRKGWSPTEGEVRAVCRAGHPVAEAVTELETIHGSVAKRLWVNAVDMVRGFRGDGGQPSG